MATIDENNSGNIGSPLTQLLMADSIEPGSEPGYQLCKTIYIYHPLGKKIVDSPLTLALSKPREITVQDSPEDVVTEAFQAEWDRLKCSKLIENASRLARIYGISTLAYDVIGTNPDTGEAYKRSDKIPPERLHELDLIFHTFDPLNTAGSMVLNQDAQSANFQRVVSVAVQGEAYDPTRCVVAMNEDPIYIHYTSSAYGFVGRSAFQRALYPLKSFISSMVTDNAVQDKAALLVAKMKQPTSIVDQLMQKATNMKAVLLNNARTGNTFVMGIEESVESINLTNIEGAVTTTRNNIIENIATAADIPAQLIKGDTLAQGFGEGSEDAKSIARFIDSIREDMLDLFEFMDKLIMRKAWTPEFFAAIQNQFPAEYMGMTYEAAFCQWSNSFEAVWPDLIEEREENRLKAEDTRLKGLVSILDKMGSMLDPENKAALVGWAADNLNDLKKTFPNQLEIDIDALINYVPPVPAVPGDGEDGDDNIGQVYNDAADGKHWITTEEGSHILINGDGEVIGGAGGKLNGKQFSPKSKSKDVSEHVAKTEAWAEHGAKTHGGDKGDYLRESSKLAKTGSAPKSAQGTPSAVKYTKGSEKQNALINNHIEKQLAKIAEGKQKAIDRVEKYHDMPQSWLDTWDEVEETAINGLNDYLEKRGPSDIIGIIKGTYPAVADKKRFQLFMNIGANAESLAIQKYNQKRQG